MSFRTTVLAVEKIIEVDQLISDLDPFLETANALVTEVCVPSGYDDARLELIERWLAAHFYAIRDPRIISERAGSVQANYGERLDLGLNQTRYGQQALMLDTAGGLAALNAQNTPGGAGQLRGSVVWLGKDDCLCP